MDEGSASVRTTKAEAGAWTPLGERGDLAPGEMRTFKAGDKQLVVGRTAEGCPFALDNRCPHEGYPLATGTLKDDALTCCWHNWKFDVRDGACVLGGEAVRHYPTREVDGALEVDLTDPDPRERIPDHLVSLREAMFHQDMGRALRDAVRLLDAGLDGATLLAEVAAFDAEVAEYGSTHALPVAADCARALEARPGADAVYAIAPAIDMCAEANRRLSTRPLAPAAAIDAHDPEAIGRELLAVVEAEDAARAEALLLGAFDAGVPLEVVDRWMFDVLAEHFLDFGHALIYFVKAQELLARVDRASFARRIYPGLLYGVVLGTREDTLPYMTGYTRRLDAIADALADVRTTRRATSGEAIALRDAVLDGSIEEGFGALWDALRAGVDRNDVARALVGAAAHRMWRFDVRLDSDPDVVENWLWATHRFTFASAARNAVERFDSPRALRFLFHAFAFVHSGRRMDREDGRDLPRATNGAERDGAASARAVLDAVGDRDAARATQALAELLADRDELARLRDGIVELCLSDPLVRPIVVAHAIKTSVAAFEEFDALDGHPDRDATLFALVRFLASPIVERRVRETARRSIRWVAEGVMPAKLTQ